MALPKEPRQKMINLMYLVLTALLALNVSAEILNAFKTVNNSLQTTNNIVGQSTGTYIASLQSKLTQPESREKAAKWYPIAQEAQQYSNQTYTAIQQLKDSLMRATGFDPVKNGDSSYKFDDIEASERIIVQGGEGKKLFQILQTYKSNILSLDAKVKGLGAKETINQILTPFPVDLKTPQSVNKNNNTWESAYFTMTPTIAALTILSKFQNDVRTTENKVVEYCHNQVGQVEVRFDQFAPIVGANSTYLMPGQELTITAGLGAFNSQKKPTITINGSAATIGPDGLATFTVPAGGSGAHSANVVISYVDQDGNPKTINKTIDYAVGSPTGASVSADAVKVFYVGLDNPISVSGGNVGDEKVSVSMTNGSLSKTGAGKYIVKPGKAGTPATVTVVADGKPSSFDFKVKDVPDPVAKVGINKGGRMRVNDFKAQPGVRADLENFVFEGVKFNVTGFTIVLTGAGFPQLQYRDVKGASFSSISDLIEKCKPGSTATIDNIAASGPGGTRYLPPIVFNLY